MAQNEIFISRRDRLESSARMFETKKAEFVDTMDEVKRHMTDVESMWESTAADSFMEQFKKLYQNFTAYEKAISEYSRTLQEASEKYAERDQQISTATAELDNSRLFA